MRKPFFMMFKFLSIHIKMSNITTNNSNQQFNNDININMGIIIEQPNKQFLQLFFEGAA